MSDQDNARGAPLAPEFGDLRPEQGEGPSETAETAESEKIADLRAQVAAHQRRSLFYARELAAAHAQLRETRQHLQAEAERLRQELGAPHRELDQKTIVALARSPGVWTSISRSLRMIGYLLFPFGRRRRIKRRLMLAALWGRK